MVLYGIIYNSLCAFLSNHAPVVLYAFMLIKSLYLLMGRKCLDLCVYTVWVDAVVLWGSREQNTYTPQSQSQTIRRYIPQIYINSCSLCIMFEVFTCTISFCDIRCFFLVRCGMAMLCLVYRRWDDRHGLK